eukprot:jgi/Tetstr1/454804/TSEL_041684.t1
MAAASTEVHSGNSQSLSGSGTQLLVVDPLCLVEGVKRQLARKAGIPAEQRRLTFSAGGGSLSPWDAGDDTLSPAELGIETGCREEELAGECRSWRAILYRDERAIGQLLRPRLLSDAAVSAPELPPGAAELLAAAGVSLRVLPLAYDVWRPASGPPCGPLRPLDLPVDDTFGSCRLRAQVFGSVGGTPLALPHRFEVSGKESLAGLSVARQKREYVARHRAAAGLPPLGPSAHAGEAAVLCGRGFERTTAVFGTPVAASEPSWLKRLVLPITVAVLEAGAPGGKGAPRHKGKGKRKAAKRRQMGGVKEGEAASAEAPPGLAPPRATTGPEARAPPEAGTGAQQETPAPTLPPADKDSGGAPDSSAIEAPVPPPPSRAAAAPPGGEASPGRYVPPQQRAGAEALGSEGPEGSAPGRGAAAGSWRRAPSPSPASPKANPGVSPGKAGRSPRRARAGGRAEGRSAASAASPVPVAPPAPVLNWRAVVAGSPVSGPAAQLSEMGLSQNWDSPMALPHGASLSACTTPVSGMMLRGARGGGGGGEPLGGGLPAPGEVVAAAAERLNHAAGGGGGGGGGEGGARPWGHRRRWSADFDAAGEQGLAGSPPGGEGGEAEGPPPPLPPLPPPGLSSPLGPGALRVHHHGPSPTATAIPTPSRSQAHNMAEGRAHPVAGEGAALLWGSLAARMLQSLASAPMPPPAAAPPSGPPPPPPPSAPPLPDLPLEGPPVTDSALPDLPGGLPPDGAADGGAPVQAPPPASSPLPSCRGDSDADAGSSGDASEGVPPGSHPTTDIDRLLVAVTPVLADLPRAAQQPTMERVWDWFNEPSVFGQGVYTMGGTRGASMSYYVPFISAIRLFTPHCAKDVAAGDRGAGVFTSDVEGWPPKMRLACEFIETAAPKDRLPLTETIDALADGAAAYQGGNGPGLASSPTDARLVKHMRLADLHPHSWFAVTWYPIYRIPDAPLKAAFLTYHTLAPAAMACRRGHPEPKAPPELRVVGLEWYAMGSEAWFDASPDAAPGADPAACQAAVHDYISELRVRAGRLARSLGVRGGRTLHHDYNFFNFRNRNSR